MSGDSSTAATIPTGQMTDEGKPAKQSKMVYCETCHYSLNSETQATAHYSGKSHLKRLKQLKHGNQANSTFRPYKPRTKAPDSWSAQTQAMTRWRTELQQPHTTRFNPLERNFRFGSPYTLPSQSFKQFETTTSSGYSFNSFPSICSSDGCLQSTRFFDQSAGLFEPATNQLVQTNPNPVTKAVLDNFLGILPTKRCKIVKCDICELTFNSDSQAKAHFQGAKHQRKVRLASGVTSPVQDELKGTKPAGETQPSAAWLRCDICHISVNSQKQLDAHNQGQNHKNKVGLIESGQTEAQPWTEVPGHKGGWFYCNTCNISVTTSAALGQHVHSAEHISRNKGDGLQEKYVQQ